MHGPLDLLLSLRRRARRAPRARWWGLLGLAVAGVAGVALVSAAVGGPRLGADTPSSPSARAPTSPVLLSVPLDASHEAELDAALRGLLRRPFVLTLPSAASPQAAAPSSTLEAAATTGASRALSAASLGASVDEARLSAWLGGKPPELAPGAALPLPLSLDPSRAVETLVALKDEVDRAPVDARYDAEADLLVTEREGLLLDVAGTLSAIERALRRGEWTAAASVTPTAPRRRVADLAGQSFGAVLARFETNYDRAAKSRARTFNLSLAASKLDGLILMPGEELDFNAVVGPRDEAHGYQVAPVIAEGELVDGIGGGTCQVSGTLHAASFFAGLDILERRPHTRPSSYLKLGLDAAVSYPSLNLRLRNDRTFPIALREVVRDGKVVAEVRGAAQERTVTLIRRVLRATPYEEERREAADLPRGTTRLVQRGVPGFRVRRYRIVRDGAHARREQSEDTYPPTTQVIAVGTGAARPSAAVPPDDPHAEYVADELLVLTYQDGKLFQQRSPGAYGEPGWTEKAGMPLWKSKASPAPAQRRR